MRTLTINIEDTKSEKAVLDYLDNMGVEYSVDLTNETYSWWKEKQLLNNLNTRSNNLNNGSDEGLSFAAIKARILKK